jgi:peroxiredoxin
LAEAEIIELRLSDYCHQSRLKELKATEEKDKVNYLLLSDSNGELAKAMGIAFQAPENYKTILAKDQMG